MATREKEDLASTCSAALIVETEGAGTTQPAEARDPDDISESAVVPQFFDIAAGDAVSEIDCASSSASWDREADDRQTSGFLAGTADFLGSAVCSKLIPAASTFRRSKRYTLSANSRSNEGKQPSQKRLSLQATLLEYHGVGHRVSTSHLHVGGISSDSCSSENTCGASDTANGVAQDFACDGRRRQRASILRERSRERQRGSMQAVAERLGEVMKTRGLEVVPEEAEEELSALAMRQDEMQKDIENGEKEEGMRADVETVQLKQVTQEFEDELRGEALIKPHADNEDVATIKKDKGEEDVLEAGGQQREQSHTQNSRTDQVQNARKRFTLPLSSSWRRRPSNASVFSTCSTNTDSEDSMSSAGLSESSGSSCQTPASMSLRSFSGHGQASTAALDALFERVRHTARKPGDSCHTTSTTAGSSRASSPVAPSVALPTTGERRVKPVPTDLARSEEGGPELRAQTDSQLVSLRGSSLQAARAFNFCFQGGLCGVPLDKKVGKSSNKKAGNKTHASIDLASPGWIRTARRSKRSSVDAVSTSSQSLNQSSVAMTSDAR